MKNNQPKPTKIFVNLPVRNLDETVKFFMQMGFQFDPKYTDENATCMIIDKDIYAMLLVDRFFKNFTKKEIADTDSQTEAIFALSVDSRQKVDEMLKNAINAGAKEYREPENHSWMYGRSFEDLNGHLWEIIYMEEPVTV